MEMFLTLLGKTETTVRWQMRTGSKEEINLEVVVSPVVCHTPSSVSSHFSVLSYGLLRHGQRGGTDSENTCMG